MGSAIAVNTRRSIPTVGTPDALTSSWTLNSCWSGFGANGEKVGAPVYYMEAGVITRKGYMSDLMADEQLRKAYFGV